MALPITSKKTSALSSKRSLNRIHHMFTLPEYLIAAARQTAAAMTGNVAPLPGCNGMALVRCATPEAAER